MATSNESNFKLTITPLSNTIFHDVVFNTKDGEEGFKTSVYYHKLDRSIYPTEESFLEAEKIFNKNEENFKKAEDEGLFTATFSNGARKYERNLKAIKTNKEIEFISGRLLNAFYILDTFHDGKKKKKVVFDLFDEKNRERYLFHVTFSRLGRKFIDKITSLTSEDLKHNIKIAFEKYEYNGRPVQSCNVYVLDPEAQYGSRIVKPKFENTVYKKDKKGKSKATATPLGTKAENKTYLEAFQEVLDSNPTPLLKFYKEILETWSENVLKPLTEEFFVEKGWEIQFTDDIKNKTVKGREIEEKVHEVIYLTPIGESENSEENTVVTSNEGVDENTDDLPF